MIFAALDEAARRDELLLVDGGLCRYHMRNDGVVVIREILVLPEFREQGIGQAMIDRIRYRHVGHMLRARCPEVYPANGFWKAMGFVLVGTVKGVNVWERPD